MILAVHVGAIMRVLHEDIAGKRYYRMLECEVKEFVQQGK